MSSRNLDSDTVSKLQDLLSVNIDSQKGFQEAASTTTDPNLKQLFNEYSQNRANNASELRQYIVDAGQQPSSSGSVSGALHRWWIDAEQALTGNDAESILKEAERGEDSICNTYEKSMDKIMDADAKAVVERQYRNVRDSHDRVKQMRDSYTTRNPRS